MEMGSSPLPYQIKKERLMPLLFDLGIMCNFNRINRMHPGVHLPKKVV
jgi:hypothetical protein